MGWPDLEDRYWSRYPKAEWDRLRRFGEWYSDTVSSESERPEEGTFLAL